MFEKYGNTQKIYIIAFVIASISIFITWQNNDITINKINYKNSKIPDAFNGYKIAHISDLHNKKFGKDQDRLLKKIDKIDPDIIVITGDLIDRRKYDLETAMIFINGAIKIAPVYYVSGNHEAWSGDFENIRNSLSDADVEMLDDRKVKITKEDSDIEILGLSDPAFFTNKNLDLINTSNFQGNLRKLSDDSVFQILLCHRPEIFDIYIKENIDLIFTGHAHGGQFRIPFVGGLVAPGQGFLPKYTSGSHKVKNSTMVVSRGLGNSLVPIRIFNRPEIILVTLEN